MQLQQKISTKPGLSRCAHVAAPRLLKTSTRALPVSETAQLAEPREFATTAVLLPQAVAATAVAVCHRRWVIAKPTSHYSCCQKLIFFTFCNVLQSMTLQQQVACGQP